MKLADGWKVVGAECMKRAHYHQAIFAFRKVVDDDPEDYATFHDLGACLIKSNMPAEGLACINAALALKPGFAPAVGQLASVASIAGDLPAAARGYEYCLKHEPQRIGMWHDLATNYREQWLWDKAYRAHAEAIKIAPHHPDIRSGLVYTTDIDPGKDLLARFSAKRQWWKKHKRPQRAKRLPRTEGRIRVGFVSADFRIHSVSHAFAPLYFGLDRSRYAVYGYDHNPSSDELTDKFKAYADKWTPIVGKPDQWVCDEIERDEIDILVDLSGHTAGMRLGVFTAKPAPIQVHGYGYLMGTGLPEMDYILLDKVCGLQDEVSEKVVELPCALGYRPPDWAPDIGPLPALRNGYVTFGYLGRWSKVDDATCALWGRILAAVPTAKLMLKDKTFGTDAAREAAAKRIGVSVDRLIFLGVTVMLSHFETYNSIDISLDPLQQNGGISTMESCWMGVPVVCTKGDRIMARVAASIMTAIGRPDYVTHSQDEYLSMARLHASDAISLQHTRETMREQMLLTVANQAVHVAAVDMAFQQMIKVATGRA